MLRARVEKLRSVAVRSFRPLKPSPAFLPRRRLANLNPAARTEDHLPWNKPATDERRAARWAAVCVATLVVDLALFSLIAFSGQDFGWKHARMSELWWLIAGQAVAVFVGAGVCWLIGAVRTVGRRAPVRRRRHAGRYVSAADLTELRLKVPKDG